MQKHIKELIRCLNFPAQLGRSRNLRNQERVAGAWIWIDVSKNMKVPTTILRFKARKSIYYIKPIMQRLSQTS